jgi:hypothetical protein
LKLGPDNLPAGVHPIDRRIAASLPALSTRLRLQDIARLLADGISTVLSDERQRPLCLLNIAGGTACDSWNALIYLRAERPDLLVRHKISIAVLDVDDDGPAFGCRVIQKLCAPGAPLSGPTVSFRHFPYQWSDGNQLGRILEEIGSADTAWAISSEGGLFEYGSNSEIIANLRMLHAATASDAMVVGSVSRKCEATRASQTATRIRTQPRSLEESGLLASEAGWTLRRAIERPFSYNVHLGKR